MTPMLILLIGAPAMARFGIDRRSQNGRDGARPWERTAAGPVADAPVTPRADEPLAGVTSDTTR